MPTAKGNLSDELSEERGDTFPEEISDRSDKDNRVRESRWDQERAEFGLLVKCRRYPASLDGHQVPADAIDDRLKHGEVLEAWHHKLQYETAATVRNFMGHKFCLFDV